MSGLFAAGIAGVVLSLPMHHEAPPHERYKVKPVLESVQSAGVRINGSLGSQVDGVVKNWLITLPERNPAILAMFRDQEKTPYRDYLPWSGEFAGKHLTAGAEVWRLTRDPKLKSSLEDFVRELAKVQAEDGYLGPFPKEHRLTGWAPNIGGGGNMWDAWGHYHAIVGLLKWHHATGDQEALSIASKIGDLLVRTYSERTVASTKSPEMNQAIVHGLALLYKATGKPDYLAGAERVVQEFGAEGAGDYLEAALAGEEFFQLPNAGPRWESLHSIMGLAELHWLTGNRDYKDAFERLYWSIAKTDIHNNGGFSSGEQAQGSPYHQGAIETCCTIAWTALGVEMLRMTGDPKVADGLELSLYNQIAALQAADGSWCTYNTPMNGVRIPSTEDISFQIRPGSEELNCCSVNAARGFGLLSDWGVMQGEKGLVVNFYGPSEFQGKVKDVNIVLRQETSYPQDGSVLIHVAPERTSAFELALRIPHWSGRSVVKVNGEAVSAQAGTYCTISRTWKKGDQVSLKLDFAPRFWRGQREMRGRSSVYRGPILYAMAAEDLLPKREGQWQSSGELNVSRDPKAWAEHDFRGSSVRLEAERFDDAGQMRISIDGQVIETLDLYSPRRGERFTWSKDGLAPGPHVLRVEATGEKNDASRDIWINFRTVSPHPLPPTMSASAFLKGAFRPAETGVGTWEIKDASGVKWLLQDFGSVGRDRMPYLSWLPIANSPAAAFSRENPSRTAQLAAIKRG